MRPDLGLSGRSDMPWNHHGANILMLMAPKVAEITMASASGRADGQVACPREAGEPTAPATTATRAGGEACYFFLEVIANGARESGRFGPRCFTDATALPTWPRAEARSTLDILNSACTLVSSLPQATSAASLETVSEPVCTPVPQRCRPYLPPSQLARRGHRNDDRGSSSAWTVTEALRHRPNTPGLLSRAK